MDKCLKLALDLADISLQALGLARVDEERSDVQEALRLDQQRAPSVRVSIAQIDNLVKRLPFSLTLPLPLEEDLNLLKDRIQQVQESIGSRLQAESAYELARVALAVSMKAVSDCRYFRRID